MKSRILSLFVIFYLAMGAFVPCFAEGRKAELVVDAATGKILHQKYAGEIRYPASLTKMMTLYLLFDALKAGRVTMGTMFEVSDKAASASPLKLGLRPGSRISVEDTILGMIVLSANDAAIVTAENLGGSEWQFAKQMTLTARKLGMNHTTFKNASGLPDDEQITTAYDLAILAMALQRNHSEYYHLFSRENFVFKGKRIKGHNRVLMHYRGADGLKTGYIRASGYNLVTSARRNGFSLIGVVMGGDSIPSRDDRMVILLNEGFSAMYAKKGGDSSYASSDKDYTDGKDDNKNIGPEEQFSATPQAKPDAPKPDSNPVRLGEADSHKKVEKANYNKKKKAKKKASKPAKNKKKSKKKHRKKKSEPPSDAYQENGQ